MCSQLGLTSIGNAHEGTHPRADASPVWAPSRTPPTALLGLGSGRLPPQLVNQNARRVPVLCIREEK